nr:MAG TPA: hypothetical protein [Caudoviricetes sp.]
MTLDEIIAQCEFTVATLNSDCVECDKKAKDFYKSVIELAKKAKKEETTAKDYISRAEKAVEMIKVLPTKDKEELKEILYKNKSIATLQLLDPLSINPELHDMLVAEIDYYSYVLANID